MAGLILLAMIAVPIMEIVVFIEAGELIGLWPTLGAVILTAFMGTALLRHQGLSTLRKAQHAMNAGQPPVAELFDGLCLVVAGLLLLTPGFLTDGVGFLLFAPPLRTLMLGGLVRKLSMSMSGGFQNQAHNGGNNGGGDDPGATIIEGEFHEVPSEPGPEPGPEKEGKTKLRPPD